MFTNAANDLPARAARLTGAEIAERIIKTDLAVIRDRALMLRARRTGALNVHEFALCAAVCGRTEPDD